jgi:hypothetical protein
MDAPGSLSPASAFRRVVCAFFFPFLVLPVLPATAQAVYKCGSTFQDRPCEAKEVQQRYSRVAGGFTIEQVNPDTDADCARIAGALLPYWQRINGGEGFDLVKAEIDAGRTSRQDKSLMRDVLIALRESKGTATQVRGQLERECMACKRRRGDPTEAEIAAGAARLAQDVPPMPIDRRGEEWAQRAARAADMRAQAEARRAAAARPAAEARRVAAAAARAAADIRSP